MDITVIDVMKCIHCCLKQCSKFVLLEKYPWQLWVVDMVGGSMDVPNILNSLLFLMSHGLVNGQKCLSKDAFVCEAK